MGWLQAPQRRVGDGGVPLLVVVVVLLLLLLPGRVTVLRQLPCHSAHEAAADDGAAVDVDGAHEGRCTSAVAVLLLMLLLMCAHALLLLLVPLYLSSSSCCCYAYRPFDFATACRHHRST